MRSDILLFKKAQISQMDFFNYSGSQLFLSGIYGDLVFEYWSVENIFGHGIGFSVVSMLL